MNISRCSHVNDGMDVTLPLLFGRVLPYLVQGLLFGGEPPYILHIADFKSKTYGKDYIASDLQKLVAFDCLEWSSKAFTYPNYVTDVIVLFQCKYGQQETLDKIFKVLSKKPSQLARPNIIMVFEMTSNLSLSIQTYHKMFIRSIINFKIIKMKKKGVTLDIQHIKGGTVKQLQSVTISVGEVVKLLGNKRDYNLDFRGALMQVTTSDGYAPFVTSTSSTNGTTLFDGYAISVLRILSKEYNFKYALEHEEWYGSQLDNGTWVGMVGLVHRQEKDMAVAGLTINAHRSTAVDFTYPFWFEPAVAAMNIKSSSLFYLLKPFQITTWTVTIIVFILTTACYCLLDYLATETRNSTRSRSKGRCLKPNDIAMWYIVQIWLSQTGTGQPACGSLRFASGIMAFCLVVFCSTYSGNLIASLTVQSPKLPLQSLDELSTSTEYLPLVGFGSVYHGLLKESKSGVYARLWERVMSNQKESMCQSFGCDDIFSENEHLVKIGDKSYIENQLNPKTGCTGKLIPEEFFPSGFGIAIPKGSPYKPFFDHTIKQMTETGILHRLERKYEVPDQCAQEKEEMTTKADALSIYEVAAVFVILAVGVGSALLILVAENIWSKRR